MAVEIPFLISIIAVLSRIGAVIRACIPWLTKTWDFVVYTWLRLTGTRGARLMLTGIITIGFLLGIFGIMTWGYNRMLDSLHSVGNGKQTNSLSGIIVDSLGQTVITILDILFNFPRFLVAVSGWMSLYVSVKIYRGIFALHTAVVRMLGVGVSAMPK